MSEVASLELCRELYELSGWETEYYYYKKLNFDLSYLVTKGPLSSFTFKGSDPFSAIPAYTLGYLLRKLPTHFKKYNSNYSGYYYKTIMQGHSEGGYLAEYFHNTNARHTASMNWLYSATADTPENAAAKLAIELFKQGVLTREDGKV